MDESNDVDDTKNELHLHEGIQRINAMLHDSQVCESPIDIHIPKTIHLDLPPLEWHHFSLEPKRVKLTNSGHTVIYSAKWLQERPYISGGPFIGNYVFSQLHFHWGSTNMAGSEHTISGAPQILEMHIVFFKSCYLTQESALRRKDGIAVIVIMFRLQDEVNEAMQTIIHSLQSIREPHTSVRLRNVSLDSFFPQFSHDYFLYVGSVNTSSCVHYVVWIICRTPSGISIDQIETFRSLFGVDGEPLLQNCRQVQKGGFQSVFHVNPSGQLHSTLLIMEKDIDPTMQHMQTTKYARSSREYVDPTGTTI